ncbi:MAG: hypothetical protein NTV08_00715 [Verrucomicrobia bacterium]|nr:hypothetical protein [Verrucomicrobiota bacterium]
MKLSRLLALVLPALIVTAFAQEPTPPTPQPPKVITSERSIFVPFEKLGEVFAGQEQGVFLPYREFLEMWNKVNLPEKLKKTEPPVDGVVAGASYVGKVDGDLAEIKAKVNFEALKDGWSQIPLGTGLALAEAKTTAILNATEAGQMIIFPKKGSYTLDATVFGKITRDKGRAVLPLKLPRTAVSQFEMMIPEKGLEFTITPASAFTATEQEGGTKLAVYFGASQDVMIAWSKKGGETALPALLFADAQTDVRVSAGALRTDVAVNYRILRSGVSTFQFEVPQGAQVLAVEGQGIKEWKPLPVDGGKNQTIEVTLHTAAKDNYQLHLTLESALGALPQKPALPLVSALKVERQTGSVTVNADAELVVEPSDLQGLTQQGVALMKDGKSQPGLVGSYRYLRLPYAGVLNVTEAKPQVEVASLSLLMVGMETLTLNTRFAFTVKKAGIFGVQIELPSGYANEEAVGPMVESSTVVAVGGKRVMSVKFRSRQLGGFQFHLTADAPRANAGDAVTAPVFNPLVVERHDAKIGMAIHVSLKANTTDKGDMREEDILNLEGMVAKEPAKTPLTIGFRYRSLAAAAVKPAQLQFELRKSRVSAEVFTLVEVRETLTRHSWIVNHNVEFAGVNEFSIEVPKAIADDLQIEGANIKERIKSDTKDVAGQPTGGVVWRVVLQDKVLGTHTLTFSHDEARTEQKPGAVLPVALHEVKAVNVFRETGQVAVLKDGNLEFAKTDVTGLETIDPKELNAVLQRDGIFLAYKYSQHPVALSLGVSKNIYLEVPQAIVTYAVLTSVIAEDGAETTEVIYWVKNNSQQFFGIQLPSRGGKQARLLSDAFVNGEPQQPSKRPEKNEVLIRLPARQANNSEFPVRFVYEVPSAKPGEKLGWRGSFDLEPPQLAGVKVLQTRWTLWLPASQRYVDFGGAMREDVSVFGWENYTRTFRMFLPQIGPAAPSTHGKQHTEPPPLPAPKSAGFDTQLRKEGVSVELRRLDAPATVNVAHRGKTYSFVVDAMAGLFAFAGAISMLRRDRAAKWAYFIFIGLGALVISGAVNPRGASKWQHIYIGTLLGVAVWLVCAFRGWLAACAERRSERAEKAAKVAREEAEKRAEKFAAMQAAAQASAAKPSEPQGPTEPPAQQ